MTPHRHWFYEYVELKSGDVLLRNDSLRRIIGQGKVQLMLNDEIRGILPSVLHILGLARNIIYVSTMEDVGARTVFEKDTCKMVRCAVLLMWGIRIGTLYKLLRKTNGSSCNQVVDPKTNKILSCMDDSTMLWHRQLGHIDKKGLHVMHRKCMVEGLPNCSSKLDSCEHFIYGKQNHVSFPSKATKEKQILELVGSDVFGPVTIPSLGGSRYYVSFINDFSKMTWIYFLKKKSEVFKRFLEFKSLVENQTNRKIKVLRIDDGGELSGKEFDQFCKQCNIA
jgi:hypothetical protein